MHVPSSASIGHKWREISDLPQDLEPWRDSELEALQRVWNKQKPQIPDNQGVNSFVTQLTREWAIETGIIEGVYTLDRGITQTLIERGISSAYIPHDATNRDPELVARIIQAHKDVVDGLFAFVKSERVVGTSYIKELHVALLRHQDTFVVIDQFGRQFEKPLEIGTYKKLPNNPLTADGAIHEYCPPEHVASEMDRLIDLHAQHEQRRVAPHIEAAWIHHAFAQIHPFEDGNGRVARAIASLIFIKAEFFPLVVNRDDRAKYIDALEAADRGDLSNLARLFAQIQKRSLTRAIGRIVDLQPAGSLEEEIAATRDMLVNVGRIMPPEYLRAKETAGALNNQTQLRVNQFVQKLSHEIARVDSGFKFSGGSDSPTVLNELAVIGEKLGYEPNPHEYQAGSNAVLIAEGVSSRITFSIHGVGARFRGLLAAVAYFQRGNGSPVPLCDDIFRISYEEPQADAVIRYAKWLDDCLMRGLAEWRRGLI